MSQTKVKSGLLNFPDQTDFVKLPSGTTAQRPSSPEKGYSRYNTTDNKLEFWNGTIWQQLPGVVAPIITSISYPGDDLAADPAGGQTITINGSDFITGATVTVDGTTPSVITFVSATEITFTAPAKTAGDYDIVVTNTDGGNATSVDGMTYNGLPSWTTPAGNLGTFEENTTIPTITLVAAEPDSGLISYSITTGGLPTGLSLAGADIDGTTPAVAGETTYNFTVTATDNENQSTERAFNIVVYKLIPSFNTVTYSGNNDSPRIISGVGFTPDLVWIKKRTGDARVHILKDSVRGFADGKFLASNDNAAEWGSNGNFIEAVGDGTFTVNRNYNASIETNTNNSGDEYVAWCWRAGGAAVTNTDGTISAQVSANTDAGFSVVSYTGNNIAGATIGHGLEAEPDMIIVKNRDTTDIWTVQHSALTYTDYIDLSSTNGATTNTSVWYAQPTTEVFSFGANPRGNGSGNKHIAYCFAEVAGFSKFGSYAGTNAAGNKITTGFEPAFVLTKRSSAASGGWNIFDNKRGLEKRLHPHLSNAESIDSSAIITFNSDGFTFNTGDSWNNGNYTYIYMAFANQF